MREAPALSSQDKISQRRSPWIVEQTSAIPKLVKGNTCPWTWKEIKKITKWNSVETSALIKRRLNVP